MRFTNKILVLLSIVVTGLSAYAQEVAVNDTVKAKPANMRQKIDGIIATVGDFNILDSDIDKSFLELSSQGNSVEGITRCQMLGKLLEDKLYAHQAIQDSIVVTDDDVKSKMEEQISYMVEQLGSMDKVVKYFKKANEEDFRTDLSEIIKLNKLTSEEQRKIVDAVEITPVEVRNFYKKFPKPDVRRLAAKRGEPRSMFSQRLAMPISRRSSTS